MSITFLTIIYFVAIACASWACTRRGYRNGYADGMNVRRVEIKYSIRPTEPSSFGKEYVSDN